MFFLAKSFFRNVECENEEEEEDENSNPYPVRVDLGQKGFNSLKTKTVYSSFLN
jgi:hypothetical protein